MKDQEEKEEQNVEMKGSSQEVEDGDREEGESATTQGWDRAEDI